MFSKKNNCWFEKQVPERRAFMLHRFCYTIRYSKRLHSIATDTFQCGRLLLLLLLLLCWFSRYKRLSMWISNTSASTPCIRGDFYPTHLTEPAALSNFVMTKDQSAAQEHSGQTWWTVVEKSFWTSLAFVINCTEDWSHVSRCIFFLGADRKVQPISIGLCVTDAAKHFEIHTQFLE